MYGEKHVVVEVKGEKIQIDWALVNLRVWLMCMISDVVINNAWHEYMVDEQKWASDLAYKTKITSGKVTVMGETSNCLEVQYEFGIVVGDRVWHAVIYESSASEWKIDGKPYSEHKEFVEWIQNQV